ncbi:MAG: HAMP domain-containing sensor histidine kinase [Candidatus Goldiibacteriota bacterium]|jgi:signal transduction histidine kinase
MIIKTIRSKVVLYFLGASALVIGLYGFMTYELLRGNLESEMENRLTTAGKIIAQAIDPADVKYIGLKGKIYLSYREKLRKLREITEVRDIFILGGDRKVLLSSLDENEKFYINLDSFEIEKAFRGETSSSPLYQGAGKLYYKTGYVPVGSAGTIACVVGVEASVKYTRYLSQYGSTLGTMGIISLALALVMSMLITGGIASRINLLRKKAEEIARRNFSENITVEGEEEISLLAATLDSMKKELKEYIEDREKMASVGEFSAGVAHEIRNSLGAISGYAELIREREKDEKTKKFAGDIVYNCMKMSEFLNNFLTYTKEFTPEFSLVKTAELISETISELPEAAGKVIIDRFSGSEASAKCDPYLIKKALYNIIINGYQALDKPDGKVEIFLTAEGDRSVIVIKDNGAGMGPEELSRIFQPFVTGKKEGTGLGLAIVYRIIKEIHKGEIYAASEAGKGSEFAVKI